MIVIKDLPLSRHCSINGFKYEKINQCQINNKVTRINYQK